MHDRNEVPSWVLCETHRARFKPTWKPCGEKEWTDATIRLKKGLVRRISSDKVEAVMFTSRSTLYIEKAKSAGFNVPFPKASEDSGEVNIIAPLSQLKELIHLCGGTKRASRNLTDEQRKELSVRFEKFRVKR